MAYGILDDGLVIAEFVVPLTLRSNKPIFMSDTLSLKRSSRRRSAQRWELETRLDPKAAGANELMAHIILKDNDVPFTIITPQNIGVIQARTSVSAPSASGSAGASAVTITNNAGLIPKGTFVKFANHSKVYMTGSRLNGNGTLTIYPTLRADVVNQVMSHRDDVLMSVTYDSDVVKGMVFDDGILMDVGVVKLIESIK